MPYACLKAQTFKTRKLQLDVLQKAVSHELISVSNLHSRTRKWSLLDARTCSREFVTHHSVLSNTIGDKALRFVTINSTDENKNSINKWQSRFSVHMLNLRADQLCICCTHPTLMKWCAAAIMPVWGLSAWVSQRAETDRDTDGMNFRENNKWERKRMQAETGHLYVTETWQRNTVITDRTLPDTMCCW